MNKFVNKFASRALSTITALSLAVPAWAMEAQAGVPLEPSVSPVWVLAFFALCAGGIYWYVVATNKASAREKLQQK